MQKRHLLLILLMALFAPLAMNGQQTLPVADQGGTTSDSHVPFEGLYADDNYQHTQTIYPSSMLTAMQGGTITKLTYYLKTAITTNLTSTFEVRLGTTTSTSFNSGTVNYISMTGSANYTGTIDVTNSSKEVTITLATPYTYSSGNLVVDVRLVNHTTGYKTTDFLGETGSTYYSVYSKTSSSQPPFTQGSAASFMPKTTFTYTSTTPYISLTPATATVLTGFTQTLTATYGNVSGTPTITYASSNTSVATVSGSGATATVTGVAPGTATITATMTVSGSTYTATSNIIVENPSYCTPAPTSIDGSGITNVTFGTVNDNFTMNSSPYYYDHSNMIGGAAPGSTVNMSIAYATNYTYYTWVWVDWNKDYVFDDTDLVYPSTQTISSGTLSIQFNVPSSVTSGDYRMRIQGADNSSKKNPCYTGSYSYLVDYTLRVSSDPTISLTPATATLLAGSTETITATVANVSGTPSISYSSSNTSVATVTGSGTTATVTGVSVGTATITATMTVNGTPYTATCTVNVADLTTCQGFETDLGFWTVTTENPNYTWARTAGTGYTSAAGTGNYNVGAYYSSGAYTYTWLTLSVDLSSYTDKKISFQYINPAWSSDVDDINFQYSTDGTTYTTLESYSSGTSSWTQVTDLSIPDAAKYIRFEAHQDYGRGVGLDEICLDYTEPSSCPKPKDLVVSDITSNSAKLAWTPGDSETSWEYLCIAHGDTPDWTSQNVITSFTHTNVPANILAGTGQQPDPDTEYDFYVRAVCGGGDYSTPAMISFTTLEACPKPTNLTVSNLAASHANVSWDSEAGNYTVKYSTATVDGSTLDPVFEDGFENGLTGWTTYAVGNYTGSGYDWQQILGSNFSGTSAHNGSYVAMSRSYGNDGDQSVDNWLVTPQMTLGDVVKFWVCGDNAGWQEYFTVYVSTGTNAISDFVQIATPELAPGDGTWAERTVDLSAYAGQQGYVAIRHTDEGKDYLFVDDFRIYNTINTYSYGGWTTVNPNPTTESCQITGLSAETLYEVQVQANCGGTDGSSAWSIVRFTTPDNCGAPQELATSNVTATSATLSWADDKDSYNLQYRKVYFHEGFEGGTLPTGWTTIDANNDGLTWSVGHATAHSGSNGAYNVSYVYSSDGSITTTPDDYLVSPLLDLQGTLRVWLSGYPRQSSNYSEHFAIYISTNGNTASDFTTTLVAESITTNSYVEYTADLSSYAGQQGYIAIRHFNCTDQYYLYVDDFGLYGSENWVTLSPNPTTETANLTGLTPTIENENHLLPTTYEWQVQGVNCDGNGGTTEWSDVATFTTLEGYKKHINAYSSNDNGWYLIASPLADDTDPAAVTNMLSNNYDLYYFDQNGDSEGKEWINIKQGSGEGSYTIDNNFKLVNGKGYLYANSQDVDLTFIGAANTTNNTVTLTVGTNEDANMIGWNLVGNPFAVDAYITVPFYTLEDGDEGSVYIGHEATDHHAIAPMEGILVHIGENDPTTLTFSKTNPGSKGSSLNLNLTQGRGGLIDRAIVSFSDSQTLPKMQFRDNRSAICIPVDGKDYAVVSAENQGEMPISFKAEENGTYTLSFNSENVSFGYLHLVDNMTGADIDLLANPSYTFEAKKTDYRSRFKLVFATGTADDTFAFCSNGNWVINNEGNATLQVIDVNGRIIRSESINGCANVNLNVANGVYMIRLINGSNVKTQKVVVR